MKLYNYYGPSEFALLHPDSCILVIQRGFIFFPVCYLFYVYCTVLIGGINLNLSKPTHSAAGPNGLKSAKNDYVGLRTLKILQSVSEFGGLRKHEETQRAHVGLGNAALAAAVALPW